MVVLVSTPEDTIREALVREALVRTARGTDACAWCDAEANQGESHADDCPVTLFEALVREAADQQEALRYAEWAMKVRQKSDDATDTPFDENIGEALNRIEALAAGGGKAPADG